jgi:uncharacterized protein YxjI
MSALTPIAPQTVVSGPTTLVIKERKGPSLTGDSGKIKDDKGNLIYEIDAKHLTISGRRVLLDASGKQIAQGRGKKMPGIHPAMYIGPMDDEKKCMVKVKGMLDITKTDADIYMDDKVIGEVSGNWRAKSFKVSIEGKEVATIERKTGVTGHLLDADSYTVEIAAGVDTAFICMVVISLDELYHD